LAISERRWKSSTAERVENPKTGEVMLENARPTEEYEITFTGKDVGLAKGWFKKDAEADINKQLSDKEAFYRSNGYGVKTNKFTMVVDGFHKRDRIGGFRREKILYRNGERIVLIKEEM